MYCSIEQLVCGTFRETNFSTSASIIRFYIILWFCFLESRLSSDMNKRYQWRGGLSAVWFDSSQNFRAQTSSAPWSHIRAFPAGSLTLLKTPVRLTPTNLPCDWLSWESQRESSIGEQYQISEVKNAISGISVTEKVQQTSGLSASWPPMMQHRSEQLSSKPVRWCQLRR